MGTYETCPPELQRVRRVQYKYVEYEKRIQRPEEQLQTGENIANNSYSEVRGSGLL